MLKIVKLYSTFIELIRKDNNIDKGQHRKPKALRIHNFPSLIKEIWPKPSKF